MNRKTLMGHRMEGEEPKLLFFSKKSRSKLNFVNFFGVSRRTRKRRDARVVCRARRRASPPSSTRPPGVSTSPTAPSTSRSVAFPFRTQRNHFYCLFIGFLRYLPLRSNAKTFSFRVPFFINESIGLTHSLALSSCPQEVDWTWITLLLRDS